MLVNGPQMCWKRAVPCPAGLLITYTVMFGDVLVGKAPDYNGALTNLTGKHSGGGVVPGQALCGESRSTCVLPTALLLLMKKPGVLAWQSPALH